MRNTVANWLRADLQPPKYRRPAVNCELTPFEEQLTQALRADARRPKAERRTARRLFAELQVAGNSGGYSWLTDFIRARRHSRAPDDIELFSADYFPPTSAIYWEQSGLGRLPI